jgi:hypothetical protein
MVEASKMISLVGCIIRFLYTCKKPMWTHVIKKKILHVPMARKKLVAKSKLVNNFEIPFPMALKRTPKSISSLSFVFLGLDVLMLFLFKSVQP